MGCSGCSMAVLAFSKPRAMDTCASISGRPPATLHFPSPPKPLFAIATTLLLLLLHPLSQVLAHFPTLRSPTALSFTSYASSSLLSHVPPGPSIRFQQPVLVTSSDPPTYRPSGVPALHCVFARYLTTLPQVVPPFLLPSHLPTLSYTTSRHPGFQNF